MCRVPGAPAPSAGETRRGRRRRPSCSRGMTTRRKGGGRGRGGGDHCALKAKGESLGG